MKPKRGGEREQCKFCVTYLCSNTNNTYPCEPLCMQVLRIQFFGFSKPSLHPRYYSTPSIVSKFVLCQSRPDILEAGHNYKKYRQHSARTVIMQNSSAYSTLDRRIGKRKSLKTYQLRKPVPMFWWLRHLTTQDQSPPLQKSSKK